MWGCPHPAPVLPTRRALHPLVRAGSHGVHKEACPRCGCHFAAVLSPLGNSCHVLMPPVSPGHTDLHIGWDLGQAGLAALLVDRQVQLHYPGRFLRPFSISGSFQQGRPWSTAGPQDPPFLWPHSPYLQFRGEGEEECLPCAIKATAHMDGAGGEGTKGLEKGEERDASAVGCGAQTAPGVPGTFPCSEQQQGQRQAQVKPLLVLPGDRSQPYLCLSVTDEQQCRGAQLAGAPVQGPQAEAIPRGAVQQAPGLLPQPGGQVEAQLGQSGLRGAGRQLPAAPCCVQRVLAWAAAPACPPALLPHPSLPTCSGRAGLQVLPATSYPAGMNPTTFTPSILPPQSSLTL